MQDRANFLLASNDCRFRDIYLLASAAEDFLMCFSRQLTS